MAEEGMEEEECGRLDLAPPPPTRPISKLNQFLLPIYNVLPSAGISPGKNVSSRGKLRLKALVRAPLLRSPACRTHAQTKQVSPPPNKGRSGSSTVLQHLRRTILGRKKAASASRA